MVKFNGMEVRGETERYFSMLYVVKGGNGQEKIHSFFLGKKKVSIIGFEHVRLCFQVCFV